VAGLASGTIHVYDAPAPQMPMIVSYVVPGARFITMNSSGHVVVATARTI
jgi:hypothetical protein